SPIYAFTYTEPFHSIIVGVTSAIAFFSNSLLIFIAKRNGSEAIGSYRYLLFFFSICNITTTIGHIVMKAHVHMTDTGFYFFPTTVRSIVFGVPLASLFCLMFIVTFYQTFLILAYHFIYRYKTVTHGIGSSFTDSWTRNHWIRAGIIVYFLYIVAFVTTVAVGMLPDDETRALVPEEILETYGIDLKDPHTGYIVLAMKRVDHLTNETYWSIESVMAMIIYMILFGGTGAVIVFCIYKTSSILKSADAFVSSYTRTMHQQLFRALLIQTCIPCIFSYFPLSLILLFGGLTGISLGSFGNVLFIVTAIFPSVDAFSVLFFIGKLRFAVIKLFHLAFNTKDSSDDRWAHSTTTQ
ncbi:hypothetical protein PENTCL1PPCAC_16011, partial [Pristionchus entomophagus]